MLMLSLMSVVGRTCGSCRSSVDSPQRTVTLLLNLNAACFLGAGLLLRNGAGQLTVLHRLEAIATLQIGFSSGNLKLSLRICTLERSVDEIAQSRLILGAPVLG